MKIPAILLCALLTTSCANMHRYDKSDAAMVERLCKLTPSMALDGNQYTTEVGITAVDGHLPGTGVSCKDNPIHRINPSARILTFFVYLHTPGSEFAYIAYPQLDVQLRSSETYYLESTFDGKKVWLSIRDRKSGAEISHAETTELNREPTKNPAIYLIPMLIK